MTETYGHYDMPMVNANTDDLFLSWDVPYAEGMMEVVGYSATGEEQCRHKVETAGKPVAIKAIADTPTLQADGRDIAHIEITFADENGALNPVASNAVTVKVEGAAELIGIDNGSPTCHESFKGSTMAALNGMLLIMLRAKREPGKASVSIASDGLSPATIEFDIS